MIEPLKRDWVAVSDYAKAIGMTRAGVLQKIGRLAKKGVKIHTEKMGNQVVIKREDLSFLK